VLPPDAAARVLLSGTEADTDPALCRQIVGPSPEQVLKTE
jgi:hypothetical protein